MPKKWVASVDGHTFKVDISDEVIKKLNPKLKHGDRVINPEFKESGIATVIGVAREKEWENTGEERLWCELDSSKDRVQWYADPGSLEKVD